MSEKPKISKEDKAKKILFSCVEQFIKTGKAVGSNTLKESGLDGISSATIRNYYADLENEGFLKQQHTSGGRIPTDKAYRYYIETLEKDLNKNELFSTHEMQKVLNQETLDLGTYFLQAVNFLSSEVKTPVFLSAPRFDQDFVKSIKPLVIDSRKCAFVILTQFGQVLTEVLPFDEKLSKHAEKRIESYFDYRLRGSIEEEKPEDFEEMAIAEHFYRELMLRYMAKYAHFNHSEIIRSGFSNLLFAEDLNGSATLANTLSLFESPKAIGHILKEATKRVDLTFWIGEELQFYHEGIGGATLLALPYRIGPKIVGAVALLGQCRSNYLHWMETLYPFVDLLTKNLTFNIYQHGISFTEAKEEQALLTHKALMLIENKIQGI